MRIRTFLSNDGGWQRFERKTRRRRLGGGSSQRRTIVHCCQCRGSAEYRGIGNGTGSDEKMKMRAGLRGTLRLKWSLKSGVEVVLVFIIVIICGRAVIGIVGIGQ